MTTAARIPVSIRAAAMLELRRREVATDNYGYQVQGNYDGYTPYGGSKQLFEDVTSSEILASGPAGTGKSRAYLQKLHYYAQRYPECRLLIVRKTRVSLTESALVTFERDVTGLDHPMIQGVQRRTRQSYRYPNKSVIVCGGLDYPTRLFSTEFDMIYVQEATELVINEWESLLRCLRNYKLPFQQLMGDCNPDAPDHWLKKRCDAEVTRFIETHHEDNPRLFNPDTQTWTQEGLDYIAKLDLMTGTRKERLRYGRWVLAEGAIYDNWSNNNISSIEAVYDPDLPIIWAVDDGYMNPRVVLIGQIRKNGQFVVLDEYYKSQQLFSQTIDDVLTRPYRKPSLVVYDPSASTFAAEIRRRNIQTMAASNDVAEGIKVVRDYICDGNGIHSLFVHPQCVHLISEIPSYHYDDNAAVKGGDPRPVKTEDHAVDALRYLIATNHGLRIPKGGFRRVN